MFSVKEQILRSDGRQRNNTRIPALSHLPAHLHSYQGNQRDALDMIYQLCLSAKNKKEPTQYNNTVY